MVDSERCSGTTFEDTKRLHHMPVGLCVSLGWFEPVLTTHEYMKDGEIAIQGKTENSSKSTVFYDNGRNFFAISAYNMGLGIVYKL